MKKGSLNRIVAFCLMVTLLCIMALPALADQGTQLATRINFARQLTGHQALKLDDRLCQIAEIRAAELSKRFSSVRPDGTTLDVLLEDCRIAATVSGETIARGLNTPDMVTLAWMLKNSARANMLSSAYTKIGVAQATVDGTSYWCAIYTGDYFFNEGITTFGNTTVTTVK